MTTSKAICSYILLFCSAILFASCHSKAVPQSNTRNKDPQSATMNRINNNSATDNTALNSTLNKEVKDGNGNPQLLGECTKAGLEAAPYNTWFVKNYNDYQVDSATANLLKTSLAGKQLKIFMGTWCGDSRREVPRIYKILDYCGIDSSAIQLIMVSAADSAYKQSPGHEERGMDIFRVPDLIVFDEGRELGRIVESPVSSLEKDLQTLAGGGAYSPQYPGANQLIKLFREEKMEKIEKELPELAARIRPLVHSPSELNVYARVMQIAGEERKASITLKINSLLFPDQK
jgi:hypothetical protein